MIGNDGVNDYDFMGFWSGKGMKKALDKCACKPGSTIAKKIVSSGIMKKSSIYSFDSVELKVDYDITKLDKAGGVISTKRKTMTVSSTVYSPYYSGTRRGSRIYINSALSSNSDAVATFYHEYLHTQGNGEPDAHFAEETLRRECGWDLHYDGKFSDASGATYPDFWSVDASGNVVLDYSALSAFLVRAKLPASSTTVTTGKYVKIKNAVDSWIVKKTTNTAKKQYSNLKKRREFKGETLISIP